LTNFETFGQETLIKTLLQQKQPVILGIDMARNAALLLTLIFITASVLKVNPVSAPSASENTWTTKVPVPQETGGFGAAVANGKIYLMGRSYAQGSYNYEYDPETDNWAAKTLMPTPRATSGIVVYKNKIYTMGGSTGWTQETGTVYSCANEVYDPATDTWETKAPIPSNRSGSVAASVVHGKIHLMGTDRHDVYDIAADSWTSKEPPPFQYPFGSVVFDNKIYAFDRNLTHIYDPKSDTWSLGASPPISVSYAGVCATTGVIAPKRIYVFGGSVGFLEYTDVTQIYDPKSDTWTLGAPMPTNRGAPVAAVVNDQIYVIGGSRYWGRTETTNELYIPLGYGNPDPSYVVPDSTAPEVSVLSPENKTYYTTDIELNLIVSEPDLWMRYNLDNENITEILGNTTINGLYFGAHNLTVYATDEADNTGASETIYFNVEVPEPFPTTMVLVSVVTVTIIGVGLLVYFKKRKH
jgi:N-acetylneuraminic acid mutarotase